jgi:endonuclease/exonuclease/phosphatase family metal-dependent hydrolase
LTWNLYHGRAREPAGRPLLGEFCAALAGWEWDVALLQEVPPWWPPALGARCGAQHRLVLTSRNALLPLRRALAERWPDAIKSNGGGANAILVRTGEVAEHRTRRLCLLPERRWVHAVRVIGLQGRAMWFGNLHATGGNRAGGLRDARRAAASTLGWAAGEPIVLGGDFNLRSLSLDGFHHVGGHAVDHVFAHALEASGPVDVLERGRLSDHAPVAVTLGV